MQKQTTIFYYRALVYKVPTTALKASKFSSPEGKNNMSVNTSDMQVHSIDMSEYITDMQINTTYVQINRTDMPVS